MTLVSARPVREHVLKLRAAGGTYESIGRAAGTGAMTVHCIANARRPTVQAKVASKLLAINEADIRSAQPTPGGTMWRLRALVAMGHSCSRMAAATGIPPATLRRIVRGDALTISPARRQAVTALFDAWWDKAPPRQTRQEKLAARNALTRAALNGWPCPAGLDEDELDLSGYRPSHGWLPATGTGTAEQPAQPPGESGSHESQRRPPGGASRRCPECGVNPRSNPAERKDGTSMEEPQDHEPAATPETSAPGDGIQAWASLQLKDGIQRLAAIPADPGQTGARRGDPQGRDLEPDLEAEP